MSFGSANTGLAAGTIGIGRTLGGMVSRHLDGANQVHALAVQGLFHAHAQQQEHEHHLTTLKEAHGMAGSGGFEVNTGSHSVRIDGSGAAAKPGAKKPGTPRKPGTSTRKRSPQVFDVTDVKTGEVTHTATRRSGKAAAPASGAAKPTGKPKATNAEKIRAGAKGKKI